MFSSAVDALRKTQLTHITERDSETEYLGNTAQGCKAAPLSLLKKDGALTPVFFSSCGITPSVFLFCFVLTASMSSGKGRWKGVLLQGRTL